jgi:hypothetical protein
VSSNWTPYILFILANMLLLQVWLVKRSFAQENAHNLLNQAVKFYIENAGKGVALLLNTPNPAPDHIRPLLTKFVRGQLNDPKDKEILRSWAEEVSEDKNASRDERGLAFGLVGALGAREQLRDGKDKKKANRNQ